MSFLTVNYQRLPFFFFFNDTATTEIYTLSLHDALPISCADALDIIPAWPILLWSAVLPMSSQPSRILRGTRSEEHTSELQSRLHLVCRLLLEKKKHLTKIQPQQTTVNHRAATLTDRGHQ